MSKKILFLTLKIFSATGGIEKVCRVVGKALYERSLSDRLSVTVMSMYDRQEDADENNYFPSEMFRGFGKDRVRFIRTAVQKGRVCDTVVLSHINLLLAGWLIKKISPTTRIILFAHGIEVWGRFGKRKKIMLQCCDEFLCVSNYTKQRMEADHGIVPEKCRVLNNCIDPFLPSVSANGQSELMRKKYGFTREDKVLFTLTRLSSKDRYKGYDKVISALSPLKKKYPNIKYLVGGSYDSVEKKFVDDQIKRSSLEDTVIIPGYIPDEELAACFNMADMYIMPSRKEGFGIVFVEAMYYGLPVIAGNADGSVDALRNGELGILVDPDNVGEITSAIEKILTRQKTFMHDRELLLKYFGYENYKVKLEELLN